MALNKKYISVQELTGAARAAADAFNAATVLSKWLPAHDNATLDYSFEVSGAEDVDVAQFRAFDAAPQYGRLGPSITKEGTLPPISRQLPVTEFARFQFSNNDAALVSTLEGYGARLGVSIAARLELARVEAVLTGRLTLNENGISAAVDYGRDPALAPVLTGANLWTALTTAKPISNLIAWTRLVQEKSNGSLPGALLVTRTIMNALMGNSEVIQLAIGRGTDLPSRVSADQVRQVVAGHALIGDTIVVDESYSKFNFGSAVWPDSTVALLPAASDLNIGGVGSLGTTDVGVPAEALNPEYELSEGDRPGIFAAVFDRDRPEGLDVLASAVALPLLQRANATLAAKVAD
jgi:hypothetical protein